jgi:hypothetical protein
MLVSSHTIYLTDNTTTFHSISYDANTMYGGTKDAFIQVDQPTYNRGGCTYASFGGTTGTKERRAIIQFPITSHIPANATITAVELWFNIESGGYEQAGDNQLLYRINDAHTWVEGATCGTDENNVSWNKYSTGNAWGTAGIGYDATLLGTQTVSGTGWGQVTPNSTNLLTYIQNVVSGTWTDYGLIGLGSDVTDASMNDYSTKEDTNGLRPYLKITGTW